ncbi:MAG TPA: hypothetical protein VF017_06780 [Thermoanaerobaculia bacterium]|nr:hypothetical protein [Thermoanaerobaculia bacterium]
MNRYLAYAISAAATILFLAGLSLGVALGLSWVEGRGSEGPLLGWGSVAEIVVWVAILIAPAVLLLEAKPSWWWVVFLLPLGVAGVTLFRY